jgi:uracil-DNA glycosylase
MRGLLIVGLAPGMKGANRTGRPFTGDYAGDLLYSTLLKFGFARAPTADPNDGLRWSIAASPTPCAACRPRTSRCPSSSPPAGRSCRPSSR